MWKWVRFTLYSAEGLRRSSCPVLFIGSVSPSHVYLQSTPAIEKRHGRLGPLARSVRGHVKAGKRRSAGHRELAGRLYPISLGKITVQIPIKLG